VTVPRARRCSRRVAPARLSPAAASGSDHSDPAADVWARRAALRARTCAHRRARRPRSAQARPHRHRRPPSASAAPLVLRRPRRRHRRDPVVLHRLRLRWSRPWRRPEKHRVFEPSPCYYALTEKFSVDDLASGDRSAADALAEHDAIARAVPWAALHARLPYHHDPTRQAPSALLPHKVGTVADRRRYSVRIMGVPRSPQAPLGVMPAETRLADAVPRSLPVKEEAWAVPAGFPLSDPGDVPPSTEEAAASEAYHARKRRHADMERGGPAQPGSANPGSPAGAAPDGPVGPAAFPAPGGRCAEEQHDDYPGMAGAELGDGWPAAAVGGAGGARHDPGDRMDGGVGRDASAWDDGAWPAASQGDGRSRAAAGRDDHMRRTDGGQGRGRDAHAGRHWDAEPQRDDGGYPTGGAGAAAGSHRGAHAGRHWDKEPQHDSEEYPTGGAGAAAGSQRAAPAGRHWDAEPRRDGGGYRTRGAGAAAGSQRDVRDGRHWGSEPRRDGGEYPDDAAGTSTGGPRSARWDAGPHNDGPAAALLELAIVGPVATPVPGQPDVA